MYLKYTTFFRSTMHKVSVLDRYHRYQPEFYSVSDRKGNLWYRTSLLVTCQPYGDIHGRRGGVGDGTGGPDMTYRMTPGLKEVKPSQLSFCKMKPCVVLLFAVSLQPLCKTQGDNFILYTCCCLDCFQGQSFYTVAQLLQ